jgi:hypothetical protein
MREQQRLFIGFPGMEISGSLLFSKQTLGADWLVTPI